MNKTNSVSKRKRRLAAKAMRQHEKEMLLNSKCDELKNYQNRLLKVNDEISENSIQNVSENSDSDDMMQSHCTSRDTSFNSDIPNQHTNANMCIDSSSSEVSVELDSSSESFSPSYSSFESEGSFVSDDEEDISSFLQSWFFECSLPVVALTKLLKGLQRWFPELPSDGRTLLQAPRAINVTKMASGQFYSFGLKNTLLEKLNSLHVNALQELNLNFNIDGMPLYKSKKSQFWPIMCILEEDRDRSPFIISLYCGDTKPPISDFLENFVVELSSLQSGGIVYNNRVIPVNVRSFICDAPARAFIKCTKGHNAYYGCDRCVQKGKWDGRVVFPERNAKLRKDSSFRKQSNAEHHQHDNKLSPLVSLNIDMIKSFPQEYMHLACLGVMRRLLLTWTGKRSTRMCRLSVHDISALNNALVTAQSYWPCEFNRKPRTTDETEYWKATEFRSFILYLGPVYLKRIFPKHIYEHFLMFSCSIMILVSPALHISMNQRAEQLLDSFVELVGQYYGENSYVYNMHSLLHLSADVRRLGALDTFSAFPFENAMFSLKRLLNKSNEPLQQVCKRLIERRIGMKCKSSKRKCLPDSFIMKSALESEEPSARVTGKHYAEIECSKYKLMSKRKRDSNVLLKNGKVIQCQKFIQTPNNDIFIIGKQFKTKSPLFKTPYSSDDFFINKISNLSTRIKAYNAAEIAAKVMVLPYKDNELVSLPLFHTLQI